MRRRWWLGACAALGLLGTAAVAQFEEETDTLFDDPEELEKAREREHRSAQEEVRESAPGTGGAGTEERFEVEQDPGLFESKQGRLFQNDDLPADEELGDLDDLPGGDKEAEAQ